MAETATNQDFDVYAGDAANIVWTVTTLPNGGGTPVDLSTCTDIWFTASRNLDDETATVYQRKLSTGGIVLVSGGTGGQCQLVIAGGDTTNFTLAYAYLLVTYDALGKPTTVATGRMKVKPKPTASYSGDPAQANRDFIRSLVGDTDLHHPEFSDQVYDNLVINYGAPLYVAAMACRMLAAKYSRLVSKRVGDLSISNSDKAKNFLTMAGEFKAQADLGGQLYCAGISKSDRDSYSPRLNQDAIGSFTWLKAFDNHGAAGGFMPPNSGGVP